jgi:DNA repair protein RadA/Sms
MRPQIAFRLCCPDCGAWNSIESQANRVSAGDSRPVALDEIGPIEWPRRMSNILQLDALLGNGFVPGSSLLLTGTPGAGKSTLVMQILAAMKVSSLYASGEESVQQLKIRANRLKISSPRILLLFETQVRKILAHTEICRPEILVIDSIQTVYTDSSDSAPGGPSQIRKCSYELRRAAQQQGFVLILVGQVTKGGRAAGPKLLEHAVDVVLTLEAEEGRRRCLSASKNRFGSTGERCTLLMEEEGLVFRNQVAGGPAERP